MSHKVSLHIDLTPEEVAELNSDLTPEQIEEGHRNLRSLRVYIDDLLEDETDEAYPDLPAEARIHVTLRDEDPDGNPDFQTRRTNVYILGIGREDPPRPDDDCLR